MPSQRPPFDLLTGLFQDSIAAEIWSERSTVRQWLRVEAELALAQADVGLVDPDQAAQIAAACDLERIDCDALWQEARNVGYPILPLVRQIAQLLPDGPNGRVHFGATTQDIMDTALVLQLQQCCRRLDDLIVRLGDAVHQLVVDHAGTVMAGRTHAQQAVPTTFGAKLAVFLEELRQELDGIRSAGRQVAVVSLFGAGGTNAAMGARSARVRMVLASRLGLADTAVPWHVARGRIAVVGFRVASLGAVCTRLAREIIDLSRTEIAEVREQGGHLRGASSTMPQKANPISSEAVIGLSVVAGAGAGALLRAMEAGHERSAGEWQVEWMVLPQITTAIATAVAVAAEAVENLQVNPEAMRRNLDAEGGLIMSEAVMMTLAGSIGRERAHDLVYEAAARGRARGEGLDASLRALLSDDLRAQIGSLEPGRYTGEAAAVCAAASAAWRRSREHDDSESEATQ